MRTNYVLIDYENVQPDTLAGLDAEHFRVLLFVGANQNKLTFEIASATQKLGDRAQYIKIAGNGANALDFHIAFYIGNLAAQDASAFFHIISKDTGFDPLIQHLKDRKIFAGRSKSIADIPLLKASNSKSVPDKASVVIANLQQRGASKPRTLKTLTSTVNSIFQKQLSEEELVALLRHLQSEGVIEIDGTKVTYALPPSEA
ncbi:PIN domain-containing protein [Piscinibacter sp.]|uniref:PIN domain-containing protein n=1 Tax=Piscinibacter sp. TaxID=1903157 RepID=UPI0039E2ED70